jgi:predicted ATPase
LLGEDLVLHEILPYLCCGRVVLAMITKLIKEATDAHKKENQVSVVRKLFDLLETHSDMVIVHLEFRRALMKKMREFFLEDMIWNVDQVKKLANAFQFDSIEFAYITCLLSPPPSMTTKPH